MARSDRLSGEAIRLEGLTATPGDTRSERPSGDPRYRNGTAMRIGSYPIIAPGTVRLPESAQHGLRTSPCEPSMCDLLFALRSGRESPGTAAGTGAVAGSSCHPKAFAPTREPVDRRPLGGNSP